MLRYTAVGDLLMLRNLPVDGFYDGFETVRDFISQGDLRVANFEGTVHRYECPPSEESGGSWICADSEVLDGVRAFGFNMLSLANNHALDFSFEGVLKTLQYVRKAGFKTAGTGSMLAEASEPAYLDCKNGRFAFLAVTSTFKQYAMAGSQTARLMGRPGVNGLRFEERYQVTPDQMAFLKQMAKDTNINAYRDLIRSEGYLPPLSEKEFEFGEIHFEESTAPGRVTRVREDDMKRIEKEIENATLQADAIVVSIHAHEVSGPEKETPDQFIREFAHRCIDAGAQAVIGHGPHLLRPIEIYKNRPIFYSLGDFVLHNENIRHGPEQWYAAYGLSSSSTMRDLYAARSDQFTKGLQSDPRMFESVIPYWEMKNGQLIKLLLMPVELGFGQPRSTSGWPRYAPDQGIVEKLAKISEPYGTKIEVTGGMGEVLLIDNILAF